MFKYIPNSAVVHFHLVRPLTGYFTECDEPTQLRLRIIVPPKFWLVLLSSLLINLSLPISSPLDSLPCGYVFILFTWSSSSKINFCSFMLVFYLLGNYPWTFLEDRANLSLANVNLLKSLSIGGLCTKSISSVRLEKLLLGALVLDLWPDGMMWFSQRLRGYWRVAQVEEEGGSL